MRLTIVMLAAVLANPVWSIEPPPENTAPLPEQPDIPAPVESGENLEPDITIIRKGKDTIEEYRINGRLYMVKIKPSIGPPYYMVDTDGDGNMDVRRSDVQRDMSIPRWVLFSW
ncbi:MAG: DUF2782 domain-containing protein [Methylotetracoccus sp.]